MATTKTTAAPADPPAGGTDGNTGSAVPIAADDVKTEQEKGGKDPVGAPVEPGPKVEPVTVAVKEPYPTGSPPDPEAAFEAAHGFKRAKE